MTLFQKIKVFFTVRSTVNEILTEAKQMNGSKPGWKSTEFWGKIGVQVMTLWGAISGFVPPKYALIVGASLEAIYAIARTVSKAVSDIQAARAVAPISEVATATATVKSS